MKIVHLNTHSYGGAAVVARRLHYAGLASGVESKFITKYGLRRDRTPNYAALKDARLRYALRGSSANPHLYRLGKAVQRLSAHKNLARRPAGYEVFSPINTERQFADCTSDFDPDVIHLHWIAGFVDHDEFFRRNRRKQFVWTLHDMNPITGGCHHSDGCLNFRSSCAVCPQLEGTIDPSYAQRVLQSKADALAVLDDGQLTIVAPSRWLLELSMQSKVTHRFPHVLIENPALSLPEPAASSAENRRALGLPLDRKIVLFVSDNLRNPRKGIDLLFDAVRMMPRAGEVQLVGIGQRTDAPRGLNVSFPGTISDEGMLARYFACADAFASPSAAENSPLVMIEALSCGTPVIGFRVGGIPEIIRSDCGIVVEQRTAAALAEGLHQILFAREFSRTDIRAHAARHAPLTVFDKYKAVYMGAQPS